MNTIYKNVNCFIKKILRVLINSKWLGLFLLDFCVILRILWYFFVANFFLFALDFWIVLNMKKNVDAFFMCIILLPARIYLL